MADESKLSPLGAVVGAGTGLLGTLLTLKSQQDLLNEQLRDRRGAELASQQAAEAQRRQVLGAAQQTQGGLGLLQGLRSADRLQQQSLQDVAQAKLIDLQRQDAFDFEQRARREKLGAGLGGALSAAGATLATSFPTEGSSEQQTTQQDPLKRGALGTKAEALSGGNLSQTQAASAPFQVANAAQSPSILSAANREQQLSQAQQALQQFQSLNGVSPETGQALDAAGFQDQPVTAEEMAALAPVTRAPLEGNVGSTRAVAEEPNVVQLDPVEVTATPDVVQLDPVEVTPTTTDVGSVGKATVETPEQRQERMNALFAPSSKPLRPKERSPEWVKYEEDFARNFVKNKVGDMGERNPLKQTRGFTGSAIDFDGNVYPGVNPETLEIEDFRAYGTARATSNDAKSLGKYLAPDEAAMIAVAFPTGSGELWSEYIEANPEIKEDLLRDLKAKAAEARKRLAGQLRNNLGDEPVEDGSTSIAAGSGMSGER